MVPLIDGDVLRYEIGSCGEYTDDDGTPITREFDFVSGLLHDRIRLICEEVWADAPPLIFLTADPELVRAYNRMYKFDPDFKPIEYEPNFRLEVATVKPYKGNRKDREKPYHFDTLTHYMLAHFDVRIANGMEADDLMSFYQMHGDKETVICSRDKDLRITTGWHYGWPCGKQEAFKLQFVGIPGDIDLLEKVDKNGKSSFTIKGTGLMFFASQLLTGDPTDNIPGLPKWGPVKAYELLTKEPYVSYEDLMQRVATAYYSHYGVFWYPRMTEQGRLLWMHHEIVGGKTVLWEVPADVRPQE